MKPKIYVQYFDVEYYYTDFFLNVTVQAVLGVTVIKLLIHWKSKVRDYCSFLGNLISYEVLALYTVNNLNSSKNQYWILNFTV